MHKSRIGNIVIDCSTDDFSSASKFWAEALGYVLIEPSEPENINYKVLDTPLNEINILLQNVRHESRVHIDIETDDIEAEVKRLEKLGAKKIEDVRDWVVMEAPTGQRFCVVSKMRPDFDNNANSWE